MILEIGKSYCLSEYKGDFLGMEIVMFDKSEKEREELDKWAEKLKVDWQELWKAENAFQQTKIIHGYLKKAGIERAPLNSLAYNLPYKDEIVIGLGFSNPNIMHIADDTKKYEFPELEANKGFGRCFMIYSARKLQSNNSEDPRVKGYLNKKIEQMKQFMDGGRDSRKYSF